MGGVGGARAERHHVPSRARDRTGRIAGRDVKHHQPDIGGRDVGDADLVRVVHRHRRADLFSGRGFFRGGDLRSRSVAVIRAGDASRLMEGFQPFQFVFYFGVFVF